MANMFEKGPMNRAVNNMTHDANTGFAALQVAHARIQNYLVALNKESSNTEAVEYLWGWLCEAKKERETIMTAMDGFLTEFQADFPDRMKEAKEAESATLDKQPTP